MLCAGHQLRRISFISIWSGWKFFTQDLGHSEGLVVCQSACLMNRAFKNGFSRAPQPSSISSSGISELLLSCSLISLKYLIFYYIHFESSFLWATPLVPTHKERNWCNIKGFSNCSRFKTWDSIPIPPKARILGTKHKIPQSTKIWGGKWIYLTWGVAGRAQLSSLSCLLWASSPGQGGRAGGENIGVAEPSVAAAEQGRVPWLELAEFHLKEKAPHVPVCVNSSQPFQVSYGFVFSTSADSTVALSHQNLSGVGLWSVCGVHLQFLCSERCSALKLGW